MDELFRRVLADPADLGARMVYGDALVEAGDPRGELVATQCALASAGIDRVEDLIDAEVKAGELARLAGMQRRAQQLIAQHRRTWLAPLALPDKVAVRFRRGLPEAFVFPRGVEASPVLERLAEQTPITELLVWGADAPTVRAIAAMPLPGLRALEICYPVELPWSALEPLVARPSLRRLELRGVTTLDAATLARVAALPDLHGLRAIDLSNNGDLGVAPIVALLERMPEVSVTLRRFELDDTKLRALLAGAPHVRGLDIRDNPVSVKALKELVARPTLRHLGYDPGRELAHDKTAVGKAIANGVAPLRSLALGGSVNGAGLAAIAAAPRLAAGLRAIDLRNDRPGRIGKDGDAALDAFEQLVMLDVRWESTDVGLALKTRPTLAYFNSQHVTNRAAHAKLVAHFGDSIPAYTEVSAYSRLYSESRQIVVPDESKLRLAQLAETLRAVTGLVVEEGTTELIVRDPKVKADPIRVTLKKLPNKPRYITLAYRDDDTKAWARRLDQLVTLLENAV